MKRTYLWGEFVLLFWGLPVFLALYPLPIPKVLLLLPVAGLCLVSLLRDRSFDRTQLWNAAAAREGLPRVLLLFALTAPILAAGVLLFLPSAFLGLARRAPFLWGAIMLLYPLLSVYPQELIYRAFLFQRYRPLLGGDAALTGWSAAAFGFVHILYGSLVSVLLSLAGGYLFATSYRRSRSLLLAAVQHALYGDLIFTLGLGQFFYRPPTP